MRGKYTFKQNGVIVGESENIITTAGRKAIVDYMAGYTQRIGSAINLGIGTTAATLADKSLALEVLRIPVDTTGADYANNAVIFKGQIPANREFIIYETGLQSIYVNGAQYDSKLLLDFNADTDVWSAGTFDSTYSRLGQGLRLQPAANGTAVSTLSGVFFDLSGYSDVDQFLFAYRANNANTSSLLLRFKTDASNYYAVSMGAVPNGVYTITPFNKSVPVATGSPSWANITSIDVQVIAGAGGAADVMLDALRIEDRDNFREDNVLVSRSVLGTPVTKTFGVPLDVEYAISL